MYIRIRIVTYVKQLYFFGLLLFKSDENNKLLVDFDRYLKEYDLCLYEKIGESCHCCKLYYVQHWRKDYKPDTFYLNLVRKLSKAESFLRRNLPFLKKNS